MGIIAKAALVRPPIIFVDTLSDQIDGVSRIACTGAAQNVAVPQRYWGLYATIRPVGCSIQWGISRAANAPTVVSNQAVASWGPAAGNGGTGGSLADGESFDWVVPGGSTFLAWIASTGTNAWIELYISEVLAVNK